MATMIAAVPYVAFAFSVVMGGLAAASLVKSPEERWYRESYLYQYGAFIGYSILAAIGLLALAYMYHSGILVSLLTRTVVGGGIADIIGSGSAGYLGAEALVPHALNYARGGTPGATQGTTQKSRRQVGHGRYHT